MSARAWIAALCGLGTLTLMARVSRPAPARREGETLRSYRYRMVDRVLRDAEDTATELDVDWRRKEAA